MSISKIPGHKLLANHWPVRLAFIASLCIFVLGAACGGGEDTPAPTATAAPRDTPAPDTGVKPTVPVSAEARIIFQSDRDVVSTTGGKARFQLWVMNVDGSNPTRLTENGLSDAAPEFSPDGSKVAFNRGQTVYSAKDIRRNIFLMNPDGSEQTDISKNPGADDFHPSWSPDGSQIVFYSARDDEDDEIYVMDADGSNQTRLTNSPQSDRNPHWSPKGDKIVFVSFRDFGFEVYVMDVDGSNQTALTSGFGDNFDPAWSPDGSKIAFVSSREGLDDEIFVMDADGSNPTRLTNKRGPDQGPAWSPDGTKIAFHAKESGGGSGQASEGTPISFEIYVMNADGSGLINITNHPREDTDPVWSTGPLP